MLSTQTYSFPICKCKKKDQSGINRPEWMQMERSGPNRNKVDRIGLKWTK